MVVYNSNPAAIAPNQNAVLRGLAPRGPVHRGARAVPDRHRGLRRHPAARHHVPGAHRSLLRLRALLPATGAAGAAARPARRSRTSRSSALLAGRMGFDDPCFARFRRRHDPHAARFAASVRQRHHARAAGPRAFRPAACVRRRARSCRSPRAASARPTASATSTPKRWITAAGGIAARRHGTAAQVSAGADLAEERRQHELHLRPSRRGGPRRPPRCT